MAALGDELARYRTRIAEAKRWRETEGYDELWHRLIDLYRGKHFENYSPQDRIAVNIAFSTANIIYPALTVNHPKISLTARDPNKNSEAIIAEAVIDYQWKATEVGAVDEFRLAAKDYVILGHGWVKTGWRFASKERPRDPEAIQAEFAERLAELNGVAEASPELAGDLPTNDDVMAGIATTEQWTAEDRLFVERVSPFDMLVDPEGTTERNIRWIAQRTVRPLAEVQKDSTYDARARNKVKPDMRARYADSQERRRGSSVDTDRVTVWEFYDLSKQVMCVFAEMGDGFLVKPRPIPYQLGHPFVMLRNYDVPDQFYPMGDLEAIEALQHELNRTRTQLMVARSSYARKYVADEALIGPDAREALESNVDGQVILFNSNNGQFKAGDVLSAAPIHQIPADLFGYGEMVQGDINEVSGVSEYARGGGGDIRRTATEASMIQDAVNARSADKLAAIEKAIARIGKNMLELLRQYLTGEQVARIVGKHGKPIWVPYTQADIDVDADFVVEGGSTVPKNEAWRRNEAMELLQAVGPMIGQVIDPAEMARYVLGMFGVKQPEKFLMQPGPPGMPPGAGGGPEVDPMAVPPPGSMVPEESVEPMFPPPPEGAPPPTVEPESAIPGVPPAILAQLAGQVGLNPGM